MRVQLTPELQDLVERAAQDGGVSKQNKLVEIINTYFSSTKEPPEEGSDRGSVFAAAQLDLAQVLEAERERYQHLYEEHEWLKGEYALATTKLLPAAEKTMTPWWHRLAAWLRGSKENQQQQ